MVLVLQYTSLYLRFYMNFVLLTSLPFLQYTSIISFFLFPPVFPTILVTFNLSEVSLSTSSYVHPSLLWYTLLILVYNPYKLLVIYQVKPTPRAEHIPYDPILGPFFST